MQAGPNKTVWAHKTENYVCSSTIYDLIRRPAESRSQEWKSGMFMNQLVNAQDNFTAN